MLKYIYLKFIPALKLPILLRPLPSIEVDTNTTLKLLNRLQCMHFVDLKFYLKYSAVLAFSNNQKLKLLTTSLNTVYTDH